MNSRTTPTLPFHVCRLFTRNQKSTHAHTAHKIFLTEWTIWKYSSRFTCRDLNHPTPASALDTLYWNINTGFSFFKLFVRFTVSSRFDHQTRTVASAPQVRSTLSQLRQGVLMAPTGMRDDGSDGATAQLVQLCMEYWDKWRRDVLLEVRDGRIQR